MRRSLLGIGLSFLLFVMSSSAQQAPANGPQNGLQNGADSTMASPTAAASMPASDQPSSAQSAPAQGSTPQLQTRDPRYRINKTDVLSINFLFTPEYDQNLQVQPDGYVIPRGISQVKAEGMTIPEFTEALQQAYGKILHDPVITVLPTNVVPAYFIAGGEVHSPGRYTFQGDTTVAQAVSLAGGFTPAAKHSQVILYRRLNNEWVEGRRVDLKHMLNSGNLSEDIHLEPGDMLYVPKNRVSKVQQWLVPVADFAKFGVFGNFPIK
jgi:polysaccharide export outer membrane protein